MGEPDGGGGVALGNDGVERRPPAKGRGGGGGERVAVVVVVCIMPLASAVKAYRFTPEALEPKRLASGGCCGGVAKSGEAEEEKEVSGEEKEEAVSGDDDNAARGRDREAETEAEGRGEDIDIADAAERMDALASERVAMGDSLTCGTERGGGRRLNRARGGTRCGGIEAGLAGGGGERGMAEPALFESSSPSMMYLPSFSS